MAKQTYSDKLKNGNWQQRRLEIMQRDQFSCVRCKSKEMLQIHHKAYHKRRFIWQYSDAELETLCVECHRKEHFEKPIAPAKIWEGVEDKKQIPNQEKILQLQEKLKEPISEELQMDILRHIMLLQKGGKSA